MVSTGLIVSPKASKPISPVTAPLALISAALVDRLHAGDDVGTNRSIDAAVAGERVARGAQQNVRGIVRVRPKLLGGSAKPCAS